MKYPDTDRRVRELAQLCKDVRELVAKGATEACMEPICQAMKRYPHAPEPHNLLGIVLEKSGNHGAAMKHFRAAWALDPTYLPANHNLNTYGTFFSGGTCAYDESDLPPPREGNVYIEYDQRGIGRVMYRTRIEYGRHSIGCAVRR